VFEKESGEDTSGISRRYSYGGKKEEGKTCQEEERKKEIAGLPTT
jgi:hypothetical protein